MPVTLSGFGAADRLVAIVSLSDDGGTLSLTDAPDVTVEHGYGGFTDQSGNGLP